MRAGDVVSLRVRAPEGPTDVVGVLVAAGPTTLSVRRRDGSVTTVDVDKIVTGKVVGAPDSRTISVDDLQRVMALGWRAPETERLGDWLLRAGGGFTRRANSALVTGAPGVPLTEAVSRVTSWYDDRGLPARLQVPDVAGAELAPVLAERGWTVAALTHAMTAEAAHVLRAAHTAETGPAPDVRLDPEPDDAWLSAYRSDAHPLPPACRGVLTNHDNVRFASVRDGDACLAVARVTVDGPWAGLFAVEVDPAHRRKGLAQATVAAAVRWAVEAGARRCYLQVVADNEAAITLWQRLGFEPHHRYVYATAPTPART